MSSLKKLCFHMHNINDYHLSYPVILCQSLKDIKEGIKTWVIPGYTYFILSLKGNKEGYRIAQFFKAKGYKGKFYLYEAGPFSNEIKNILFENNWFEILK